MGFSAQPFTEMARYCQVNSPTPVIQCLQDTLFWGVKCMKDTHIKEGDSSFGNTSLLIEAWPVSFRAVCLNKFTESKTSCCRGKKNTELKKGEIQIYCSIGYVMHYSILDS